MKQAKEDLISVYEKALIGDRVHIDTCFFHGSEQSNHENALSLLRYAVKTYLYNWSPKELEIYLTPEILDMLCLRDLIKYIRIPKELDITDCWYIAHLVYPNDIKFCEEDIIIRAFEDVMDGKKRKLPKNYFVGEEGRYRLSLCIYYLLEVSFDAKSIEDFYRYCASKEFIDTLKTYSLYDYYREYYDDPIQLLSDALPKEQQNELFFFIYQLKCIINKIQ